MRRSGEGSDDRGAQLGPPAVESIGDRGGDGLVGLAERVTLSGGSLVHGLDEAGDFQLRAWLPWPK